MVSNVKVRLTNLRLQAAIAVALLIAPAVLLVVLRSIPEADVVIGSPIFHVIVVTAVAACALQVGVLTAIVANRCKQPALLMLALGCLIVGLAMTAHGALTPGVGEREFTSWFYRFPIIAIGGFALCLYLATRDADNALLQAVGRAPKAVLIVPTLAIVGLALFALFASGGGGESYAYGPGLSVHELHRLSGGSTLESWVRGMVTLVSAVALLFVGSKYWLRWRLSRDRIELALFLAAWLGLDAALAVQFGGFWRLSWWDYHAYLLAGFGAAAYALLIGYRRTRMIDQVLGGIVVDDPLDQIYRGSPDALRALVGAVEAKDRYTHGHSGRVAQYSSEIAASMGLEAGELRKLVQGAIIHDIGKIGVPDEVLNKPGALTEAERSLIEQHPVVGWEIAQRTASLRDALPVIRHHHERWDGKGYPDGLAGEAIPLLARICAVADVWDAVTSERSYRPAWEKPRALALLRDGRGSAFDPRCVDAFLASMAAQGMEPDMPEHEMAEQEAAIGQVSGSAIGGDI